MIKTSSDFSHLWDGIVAFLLDRAELLLAALLVVVSVSLLEASLPRGEQGLLQEVSGQLVRATEVPPKLPQEAVAVQDSR